MKNRRTKKFIKKTNQLHNLKNSSRSEYYRMTNLTVSEN